MNKPMTYVPSPEIRRVQGWALWIGVAAIVAGVIGAFVHNGTQFFHSYLLGFLFWTGMALGCLAIMMMHHLTSGAWGVMIRRVLESASTTLLLMALLFVPIAFGLRRIYYWVHATALPPHEALYLNVPFFLIRTLIYFLIWLGLTYTLNNWSHQQDQTNDGHFLRKMRVLSGPGLVIYGVTVSFAAVDWMMSLEPHWTSTIFGLLIIAGQLLSAMAFVIVVIALLGMVQPMADWLKPSHLHDLGKLLLTFTMLWAYMAFSQLLIIWEGNLATEIPWYLRRWRGGWVWIGVLLIVLHFFLPFFLLLSEDLKRNARSLASLAAFILVMRGMDLFWETAPEFSPGRFQVHWMDIVLPIGIGGLWCAAFAWQLQRRPLLPIGDPQLPEALKHE